MVVHRDCEFVPDAVTDHALGLWLVEQGRLEVAEYLRPHLNYESIGAEYRNDHHGMFVPDGYVGLRPEYVAQMQDSQDTIRLTLASSQNEYRLGLPASDERLALAKLQLGVEDFTQARIVKLEIGEELAPLRVLLPMDGITAENANELAGCVEQMSGSERQTYFAALDAKEPATFTEALDTAIDLDDYELVSDSEWEYGRETLRRLGADEEILDVIDGYTDFEQLGWAMMEEDGVRQTSFGMVRRLSRPFPEQSEMGMQMQ